MAQKALILKRAILTSNSHLCFAYRTYQPRGVLPYHSMICSMCIQSIALNMTDEEIKAANDILIPKYVEWKKRTGRMPQSDSV